MLLFHSNLAVVVHRVSKNVPPMTCYNFETHEQILIFFGRNITDKVVNQQLILYATSNHIFHSNVVLVESAAAVGLCCTQCAVFLKEHIVMCLIASSFVEIVRYPLILSIDFHLGLTKNNSHLLHSDRHRDRFG